MWGSRVRVVRQGWGSGAVVEGGGMGVVGQQWRVVKWGVVCKERGVVGQGPAVEG
jgi:hypothetical protein